MTTPRLHQLLQFYKDEPNDPFNAYALALEYQKYDAEKAKEFFDLLITEHEGYVPTYYHAAKFYQALGERDRAIQLYEKGIAEAKKKNDLKALRELQSAYQELVFE
jgi:lipoprotein NlpI